MSSHKTKDTEAPDGVPEFGQDGWGSNFDFSLEPFPDLTYPELPRFGAPGMSDQPSDGPPAAFPGELAPAFGAFYNAYAFGVSPPGQQDHTLGFNAHSKPTASTPAPAPLAPAAVNTASVAPSASTALFAAAITPAASPSSSNTVTIATSLDFKGSGQSVPGSPSFSYNLPSFLDPSYSGSTSFSVLGINFSGGYSLTAGLSGGLNVSLGAYSFDYPVTVDVTLPTNVNDGQVFTVDPTLASVDDAVFSMTGPSASLTLSLGNQRRCPRLDRRRPVHQRTVQRRLVAADLAHIQHSRCAGGEHHHRRAESV